MIETLLPVPVAMRVIDGRGVYDPGPLEELVLAATRRSSSRSATERASGMKKGRSPRGAALPFTRLQVRLKRITPPRRILLR